MKGSPRQAAGGENVEGSGTGVMVGWWVGGWSEKLRLESQFWHGE